MTHESVRMSHSSDASISTRSHILKAFREWPGSDEELERSLGLFTRGSLLARHLAIADIYKKILEIPGTILDLGTWRGQTAVICENLRAIYEPLNFSRRIYLFDTFEGYKGFGEEDSATDIHKDGTYSVESEYKSYLENLISLHEVSNAMGHNNGKHSLIAGDIRHTLPQWLKENKSEIVALAFLDLNSYEPTSSSFEFIWDRLVPGGIIAVWQLTQNKIPAEGRVYVDRILNKIDHQAKIVKIYPGLSFISKS